MSKDEIKTIIVSLVGILIIATFFSFKKMDTPSAAKIASDISYFVDYKGCEFMVVRNHTEDAGLNTSLVNAYFQVVHMPTCNNVKHSK